MSHPSFLELDTHAVSPDAQPAIAAHLAECPTCAGHLERVRAVTLPPVPMLPMLPMLPTRRTSPSQRTVTVGLLGAALAATLALLLVPRLKQIAEPETETVTAKSGSPAVQLWVKHDQTVRAWRGEAVRPGEAVRFEVAPAGFSHLSVIELTPSPHVIYEVAVNGTAPTLTPAWVVDSDDRSEELAIILTREPMAGAVAQPLRCVHDQNEWCTRFTLSKSNTPPRTDEKSSP